MILRSERVSGSEMSGGSQAFTRMEVRHDPAAGVDRRVVNKTYRSSPYSPATVAREVVSAAIGRAMGVRVPTTIVNPNDPAGFSVYLEYLDGESAHEYAVRAFATYDALKPYVTTPEGRRMGLFDLLLSNTDRHGGNWMILADGGIAGIDQTQVSLDGSDPEWRAGTFTIPYLVYDPDTSRFEIDEINDLSPTEAARIRSRLAALLARPDIRRLLAQASTVGLLPDELDATAEADATRSADGLLARWDAIAAMARGAD